MATQANQDDCLHKYFNMKIVSLCLFSCYSSFRWNSNLADCVPVNDKTERSPRTETNQRHVKSRNCKRNPNWKRNQHSNGTTFFDSFEIQCAMFRGIGISTATTAISSSLQQHMDPNCRFHSDMRVCDSLICVWKVLSE